MLDRLLRGMLGPAGRSAGGVANSAGRAVGAAAHLTHDVTGRALVEAHALMTVTRAGLLGPEPPHKLAEIALALQRYGPVGAASVIGAVRHGNRFGWVDEIGPLTFAELDRRSNALADALARRGLEPGSGVGILCRNHRGFIDATFACAKAGYRALYLNTEFAPPQAREVCAREGVDAVVYDEEFADVVAEVRAPAGRFVAWSDAAVNDDALEALIAGGDTRGRPPPPKPGALVILTSGTTGAPKGANRPMTRSLALPGAVLSKIPYRGEEAVYVAPPMFHAWGLLNLLMSLGTGCTVVTARRFEAGRVLDALARHRCTGLVVVPVMLDRLLALGGEAITSRDLSGLRFIASSGSPLGAERARRTMEVFGNKLYNLYGSTEVAYATIATPDDLRADYNTAGRPPFGTTIRLYDAAGNPVGPGEQGRIFVGNGQTFGGYTGGGSKQVIDGLMATGDIGHFDDAGRLVVDGRDDEMIVSGGENVFPGEVEELLSAHPGVVEAAVVGVPDEAYGQRLCAFVVRRPDAHHLDEEAVRRHVRENLARYKVPRQVVFLAELPRNPAGKVRKRDLVDQLTSSSAAGSPG